MYGEQPKDEQKATPCPKCSGNMLIRGANGRDPLVFTRKPGDAFFFRRSPSVAFVCDNCGYAEIYATNPERLRD